jgi:hypothetical protein
VTLRCGRFLNKWQLLVLDDLEDNGFEATVEAEDIHRRFFEICRATVTVYFDRHDPANTKHAALVTFVMNLWIHPIDSLEKFFFPS